MRTARIRLPLKARVPAVKQSHLERVTMPIVEITLLEGRSETQKRTLVKEVTDAIVSSIGAPKEAVRIILREIPPGHFAVGGVTKG